MTIWLESMENAMNKKSLIILVPLLIIVAIGLWMVYSSSSIWAAYIYQDSTYYLKRQFIFILIGLILLFIGTKINIQRLRKYSNWILCVGLLSLIVVLIPGVGAKINGSRSWYKIGSFLFQPSELFKILIVFYMADKLAKNYLQTTHFFKTIIVLLIPVIFSFALIMLQPDFGSGVVMVGAIVMMCILCKNKFKNYLFIGSVAILAFAVLILTSSYRSERIIAFIDPYSDPLGSGFQTIQSLYAIGPGGLLGKGLNASYQKHFYLPEPQTDFIFSIFAEDYGFVGCFILLLLYFFLIRGFFKISMQEKDEFHSFLKIGLSSLIIIQICINLCVVVGLIPVTGITLPFMSYGGSSITMLLFAVGLIINQRGDSNENSFVR